MQEFQERKEVDRRAWLKIVAVKTIQYALRSSYTRLRKALGYLPQEMPVQNALRALAAPYFHKRLNGGEGDMLIGKALHSYHHKTAHMICELSPYTCMPNTMSIGAMAQVLGKYPDLLYAPIEIKGDAEVHALSRCQMILTDAKKRALQEFDQLQDKTGVSLDRMRRYEAKHPSVRKATYRVPHEGVAGTAANYFLDLAKRI
jgi:predicted nucleotide-binding protein (sugar kinase/HSP70/actin superfamily)